MALDVLQLDKLQLDAWSWPAKKHLCECDRQVTNSQNNPRTNIKDQKPKTCIWPCELDAASHQIPNISEANAFAQSTCS